MRAALAFAVLIAAQDLGAQTLASSPAAGGPAPTPTPPMARPLDLRVGKLRNYLLPGDAAKLQSDRAPVAAVDTVIVEGQRESAPDPAKAPFPGGVGGLLRSARHPSQAWRLFAPDPNAAPAAPPRNDKPPAVPRIGCGPGTNVIFCD